MADLRRQRRKDERNAPTAEDLRAELTKIAHRHSSAAATGNMLKFLHGVDAGDPGARDRYSLRRTSRKPQVPVGLQDRSTDSAESEHKSWRRRPWSEPRARYLGLFRGEETRYIREHSKSRADLFSFEDLKRFEALGADSDTLKAEILEHQNVAQLDEAGRRYIRENIDGIAKRLAKVARFNERLASETYPAIAASLGYAIVRSGSREAEDAERTPLRQRLSRLRGTSGD